MVADYNAHVLELSTVPNLLLACVAAKSLHERHLEADDDELDPPPAHSATDPSHLAHHSPWPETGDLTITPALLSAFRAALHEAGIQCLSAVSGAWGRTFEDTVESALRKHAGHDALGMRAPAAATPLRLVLASETIYSPEALRRFAGTMMALLRSGRGRASRWWRLRGCTSGLEARWTTLLEWLRAWGDGVGWCGILRRRRLVWKRGSQGEVVVVVMVVVMVVVAAAALGGVF